MEELNKLAALIRQRNEISDAIAALIGRPAEIGHIGEFIAAHMFNITLHSSASEKSSDGYFTAPPFQGKSVNIKWYAKLERTLDLTPAAYPDYYLVLTGPASRETTSRNTTRSLAIHAVFLFDACRLHLALTERSVKLGIATSIARALWDQAEIYPMQRNHELVLNEHQRGLLALFQASVSR
jgi:hypothetical protein